MALAAVVPLVRRRARPRLVERERRVKEIRVARVQGVCRSTPVAAVVGTFRRVAMHRHLLNSVAMVATGLPTTDLTASSADMRQAVVVLATQGARVEPVAQAAVVLGPLASDSPVVTLVASAVAVVEQVEPMDTAAWALTAWSSCVTGLAK